jgi:predicted sulfurtransferase
MIVVGNDGFLFKVDDIFQMGKIQRVRMNKQTSKDFPQSNVKIRKEIINFHHQLNLLKLKLND